jgi:carotenoid cleavage dioxygenase-like enzyme
MTLRTVDPATEPFLTGRYAPVEHEIAADRLEVTGTLPPDLAGAYVRNGPNPRFPPLGSYTYPLEGDGMLHGVWLEAGGARCANRWVRTQGMRAEERAGRALFGGLMTPAFVDTALLGDDPDPGWPFKLDAFVNIVRHAGRHLALEEGTPPYEVAADLGTVGRWDFAGGLPDGMCAHPKIDPDTGEMVVFRYDVEAPFLTWATIGADGTVFQPPAVVEGVDRGYMIHDFAITERHVVLVVSPLVLDVEAILSGGDPLAWQPADGSRIAVIPRDRQGPTRWVETDAFWAWHYGNAYDDGDHIVLDFPWSTAPRIVLTPGDPDDRGGFTRATLDPGRGTVAFDRLDNAGTEFPRVDDRRVGRRHRYVTVAGRSGTTALQPGEHDRLYRYDMVTGGHDLLDTGTAVGEVVFAPRPGGTDEVDGWYLAFGTDLGSGRSSLYVWDAAAFPAAPVATVAMPQRVPNGLHGNWFAAD